MKKGYRFLVVLTIVLGLLSLMRDSFIGPIALVTGFPDEVVWRWVVGAFSTSLTFLIARIFNQEFIHGYIERAWNIKVPNLIGDICSGIVIFIGGCLILSLVFKQNISALIVTGAGSAAILGFALKDFAVALATGIMLNFEDTFKVGDKVKIGDYVGRVHQISWRNTVLITEELEAIFIPNVKISNAVVINLDLPNPNTMQRIAFSIDYDVSVESAERILYAATLGAVGVKFASPPNVFARQLTSSGVEYAVEYVLADHRDRKHALHAIIKSILECMRVANIAISTASVVSFDPSKIANRSLDLYHLVQQVKLFNRCSKEVWVSISNELVPHRFKPGDVIVHAGQQKEAVFIIAEGMASRMIVNVSNSLMKQRFIATEFFGKQALFAFMPHEATVTAEADALIYELTKESLQRLFKLHPELIEMFASTLAELNLEDKRAISVDGVIKSGEIDHIKNIYMGQLEANYGSALPLTSH
jgi:small-conductance mechanosensitive channel/CRP-like cAMP-binding protein